MNLIQKSQYAMLRDEDGQRKKNSSAENYFPIATTITATNN
jgi:hypothetical protein